MAWSASARCADVDENQTASLHHGFLMVTWNGDVMPP